VWRQGLIIRLHHPGQTLSPAKVSFSVQKRGSGSHVFLALFARWWERSARRTRALMPHLGGRCTSGDHAPSGVSVVHPITVLLVVIGDVWFHVCVGLSRRVLETSSPRAERLEKAPQPRRQRHWCHPLPLSLSRISVGRCQTLFARRPRLRAGTRMRHERLASWSLTSPPSRPSFMLRRRRRLRPWPRP
jgi:hypothetical protein